MNPRLRQGAAPSSPTFSNLKCSRAWGLIGDLNFEQNALLNICNSRVRVMIVIGGETSIALAGSLVALCYKRNALPSPPPPLERVAGVVVIYQPESVTRS